ncbi:hypothetical protein AAG570_004883 [Ranatra chinensis]|uniref:Major facilitator superfamily (MFS) profile domain-containing protein n=1 Tax=Ranatra chinensis TaxID=642074 RepID=A0ABD0XYU6_9HEMI
MCAQVLATNAKNILLLGYGTTLGFPTIVIPSVSAFNLHQDRLRDTLSLTLDQISWFSSINLLCVPIGCVLSGLVTQPLGRKPSMLALNVPFVCAWLIYRWCASVGTLYAALAITGLTGGLLEAPVLTYVAEITEPEVRGLLAAMSSMCVILGIFVQFLLGTLLHWRTIALINISIPVCALIAISFVPESPYWLIGRGRLEEAEKSLMWLRGWVDREEVQEELADLKETIRADGRAAPWWRPYAKKSFLHPFALVTLAFAIGHFGGMTTLQTFAVGIFTAVGSPLDKYVSTLALGLTQLLGALFCMATVKFTGKRPLAMVSTGGAGLCFLVVALYSRVTPAGTALETSAVAWLPLVGLLTATFGTHIAIRLLPWMLIGEVTLYIYIHRAKRICSMGDVTCVWSSGVHAGDEGCS